MLAHIAFEISDVARRDDEQIAARDPVHRRRPLGGGLESDTMILHAQPGGYRATWRALSADRVRFTQESGSASSWTITFDSVYERK